MILSWLSVCFSVKTYFSAVGLTASCDKIGIAKNIDQKR